MTVPAVGQPTLWRTCRVLANRTRLQMLNLLRQQPGLSVSAVADLLGLSLPVASQYLRALEARGLLKVRRVGRRVTYWPASTSSGGFLAPLLAALHQVFRRDAHAVETIFKTATAFSHSRRIEIFRALRVTEQTPEQLRVVTRVSAPAMWRHLRKLTARGFVAGRRGRYTVMPRADALGRALARLAAEDAD
jgi:DNA-binding transcriptional ArsR family regulator